MTTRDSTRKGTVIRLLPRETQKVIGDDFQATLVAARRVQQIISYYPDSVTTPLPSARLVRQVERAIATGDYGRFAKKHGLKRCKD